MPRGGNMGWNIREGFACFDLNNAGNPPATCRTTGYRDEPLIPPILVFGHTAVSGQPTATVVIGGYVYRGGALPALAGQYVFGNYTSRASRADGDILAAVEVGGAWTARTLAVMTDQGSGVFGSFVLAFGEDPAGELYVLTTQNFGPVGTTGAVWKIVPTADVSGG